jgi:ribosomal protein S18 acetylase RimI-like enzyme
MTCKQCGKEAVYWCGVCGGLLCARHARSATVCVSHLRKTELGFKVHKIVGERERCVVRKLVRRFWGEEEQLIFDRKFTVAELPGYLAKVEDRVVGFISFSPTSDALIVVALGVLPEYQCCGIGSRLVKEVECEARRLGKSRVFVSTSNDDLPALSFYQSRGFHIYEVKSNIIAEKHGKVMRGIGGLPVRDELRLQKRLN